MPNVCTLCESDAAPHPSVRFDPGRRVTIGTQFSPPSAVL